MTPRPRDASAETEASGAGPLSGEEWPTPQTSRPRLGLPDVVSKARSGKRAQGAGLTFWSGRRQAAYPPIRLTLQRTQSASSASASSSIMPSVWAGDGVKRNRSVPRGTVG